MKLLSLISAFSVLQAVSAFAADPVPTGDVGLTAEQLTFVAGQSDEFNSDKIDLEKWNIDSKDFGPWSWEPDNVVQKGGSMHLRMVQKDHQRRGEQLHYTSGMARSDKTITYGYFEARIKGCSR